MSVVEDTGVVATVASSRAFASTASACCWYEEIAAALRRCWLERLARYDVRSACACRREITDCEAWSASACRSRCFVASVRLSESAVCFAARVCTMMSRSWLAIRSSESRLPSASATEEAPSTTASGSLSPCSYISCRRGARGRREVGLDLRAADAQLHEAGLLAREARVECVQLEHDAARLLGEVRVLLRELRS